MDKKQLSEFISKVVAAFQKQDIFGLRETANHAIEKAALSNDRQLARIALVAYCLHKMGSKQHIARHGSWKEIREKILLDLKKASESIEKGDEEGFDKSLLAAIESVKQTDEKMGNYVQNLFEKAKVKYASTAYSMGLGLGQAAALTGAEKKDLLHYIGVTKISDREAPTLGIGERLQRLKQKLEGGKQ